MSGGGIIFDAFCTTQLVINPGSISGNTSVEQTFTMPGLRTRDVVLAVVKPTLTTGFDVGNVRISADNTIAITFNNNTGSPIDAPSETYTIVVMRPEFVPGSADALSGGNVIFK